MKFRTIVATASAVAIALASIGACAQDKFPSKPLRLIVPFAAGGGTDALGRVLAQSMGDILGQQVIVENRPGAGGNIGTDLAAKAAPDGYTLTQQSNTLVFGPYLYKKLPFDVQKDLTPIGIAATSTILIVANPKAPIASLADLIAQMKDKNKQLFYATPGAGTPHHFAMEWLAGELDSNIKMVPYKSAGAVATDVVAGHVALGMSTPGPLNEFIASGRLRVLATMGATRPPEFKDTPTVSELVPGVNVTIWQGLMVPAHTPQAIVKTLSDALARAVADPEVKKRIAAIGFVAHYGSPDAMKEQIATELVRWKQVAAKAKIVPE